MIRMLRLTALQFAICAMLLRALIPAGWMPNIGGDAGSSLFTICSIDSGGQQDRSGRDGQKQADRHEVCPFAAAPHQVTPAAVALPTPSRVFALVGLSPATHIPPLRADWVTQAPRAPPAPGLT